MRLLLLTAVILAACTRSDPPLSQSELVVRMAAAERGEDLSRALFCGADQSLVNDFALRDPPPRGSTREQTRLYRSIIVTRVRDQEGIRGASLTPDTDDCNDIRSRRDLTALWRTRPTGREEVLSRSRGR